MMKIRRGLSSVARGTLSLLPSIGLVAPAKSFRPNGISLMIRTKNEEWIDLSLRSMKEFADEIVVVDTSTDYTLKLIEEVAKTQPHIKLIRYEEKSASALSSGETYTDQSNVALQKTHYRWVFKLDGDMVARTSGDFNITKLREKILKLDEKKYYAVFVTYAELEGDFFHIRDRGITPSKEAHLFTYSPRLRFINRGRFEQLEVPLYYKPLVIRDVYIFHLRTLKPAVRLLYRRFWTDWRETQDYKRYPSLQDYVAYRIQNDWGIKDINEAARFNLMEISKTLIPYDTTKYGDYPELLKEQLKNPKYKLLQEDGKIIGRNDIGPFKVAEQKSEK